MPVDGVKTGFGLAVEAVAAGDPLVGTSTRFLGAAPKALEHE
jgi:hypothetical protein